MAAVIALALSGTAATAAGPPPQTAAATSAVSTVYDPPSEGCTALIEGATVKKTYPDGMVIEWECFCEWLINAAKQKVQVCAWIPTDPSKDSQEQYWTDINSQLEMDVAGPSTNDGALVHQWSYTGATNQLWTAHKVGDTAYQLINAYSGKCMGVSAASTNDGAQIVQWSCNGSTDQQWLFQDTFATYDGWPEYRIVNVRAKKCIGIGGGSLSIGANAVIWPCDGSANQLLY